MAREWPPWDHTFWVFCRGRAVQFVESQFPNQGLNWGPREWSLGNSCHLMISKTQWLEACETMVLAWAVPPPLSMGNLGHLPSPVSDSSSTMKSWAKKSLRFYLILWSTMPQAKDPFLIYHTPDHWVVSSDTVLWRWVSRSSKTNKGSCLEPGLGEALATGTREPCS